MINVAIQDTIARQHFYVPEKSSTWDLPFLILVKFLPNREVELSDSTTFRPVKLANGFKSLHLLFIHLLFIHLNWSVRHLLMGPREFSKHWHHRDDFLRNIRSH